MDDKIDNKDSNQEMQNKGTTDNTSCLMDVFSEDTSIMDNIQSNISALCETLDTQYIKHIQEYIDKHQRYHAKHLLSKITNDYISKQQFAQIINLEIYEYAKPMQDTITELQSISYAYGSGCDDIQAYPEHNICVYLSDYGLDTGAGMEYGKIIGIWHNGMMHKKKFTRRDGFTSEKDRPTYAFNSIAYADIQAHGDNLIVKITVQQGKNQEVIVFEIPIEETNDTTSLTPEEQEAFINYINNQKDILLKEHFRENAKMPMSINFRFTPMIPGLPADAMDQQIPYQQPCIMDSYINPHIGEAAIILKAQIDHDIVDGKQYERVGYTIHHNNQPKKAFRECRYESQIRDGDIITTRAEDLL